ncbi:hypothetical protein HN51_014320 [Arachis hypogaea]|nr:Phytochrome A [Arachis hypogaea]
MLMRDAPFGIVSQSTNIIDLVRCDEATLLYRDKVWRLGVAPSESRIRELALWPSKCHKDSTGLSTDSLSNAGFPRVAALGDVVCGMVAVKISSMDVVFWFNHTLLQKSDGMV